MTLSTLCYLFTSAWLLFWALRACRSVLLGQKEAANFLILTHFVFCGVPAILNLLIGVPVYIYFVSFRVLQDPVVDCIYAVYVCSCPAIWWYFGRSSYTRTSDSRSLSGTKRVVQHVHRLRFALYVVASSPLILLPFAPDKNLYGSYAALINSPMSSQMKDFQGYMSAATIFAVFAVVGIWVSCRQLWLALLLSSPLLFSAIWLNGKRHIVLIAVVLAVLALWERRTLVGWRLLIFALLSIAAFAFYSYSYQSGIRSEDLLDTATQYEDFRVDYGRDHGIEYAIYCELHPEQRSILEYRGQSILFDLLAFIPRDTWSDKPWPYAVYATAADIGVPPESLGWGITTSWLDEAIANFSWAGLLIGPFALALICRAGDRRGTRVAQFLTVAVSSLMLAVQLSAFGLLGVAWFIVVLLPKKKPNSRIFNKPSRSGFSVDLQLKKIQNARLS